jgi:hypothetical protein
MRKITWKKLGKADFYFGFVKQLSTYRILSRYRENMKNEAMMLVGSILPSCKIHDPNCSTRQHQSAIKIATFSEIKSTCSHAEKKPGVLYMVY